MLLGKKLSDGKGLSGAGRLTIARIDSIQSFYGLCIRQNKGDSKAMTQATKAIDFVPLFKYTGGTSA
jgi:hypothetical protein